MSLVELSITFFEIGLFTIGGGVVAITLMQQMIVDKGLITPDTFYNMIAISESTPGPLGINMATYIGYNLYGIPGGVIVTISEAAPSVICIILIAKFLSKFGENKLVLTVFDYLRPVSTALIASAAMGLCRATLFDFSKVPDSSFTFNNIINSIKIPCLIFFAILTFIQLKFKANPLLIILAGAIFGVIFL